MNIVNNLPQNTDKLAVSIKRILWKEKNKNQTESLNRLKKTKKKKGIAYRHKNLIVH